MQWKFFFVVLLSLVANSIQAQLGVITGTVIDETGVRMIGATIQLLNSDIGTATDTSGRFTIENVPPATYNIRISYVGYEPILINGVVVRADEVTSLGGSEFFEEGLETETVTVIARAIVNTDNGLMTIQRNSSNLMDVISAQTIAVTGDNDAAAAIRRVTGVSVEDGRYVYIRGLGDRYSKILLNGIEVPGLDPDRNTVQLDLFPAALLDNLIVYKTFSPDLPGTFAGGLIDINTKAFPDALILKFNLGFGFNPQANFNRNFLTHKGGALDWLGMDDGTRNFPAVPQNGEVPERFSGSQNNALLTEFTRSFNEEVVPHYKSQLMNQNLNFAIGNQVRLFERPLGYFFTLSYLRQFEAYTNGVTGRYKLTEDATYAQRLITEVELQDTRSAERVLLGSLFNSTLKLNNRNQLQLNLMYNSGGDKETRFQEGLNPADDIIRFYQERTLSFQQRSLGAGFLRGSHIISDKQRTTVDWTAAANFSAMKQPDLRFLNNIYTINEEDSVLYAILPSIGIIPTRYTRTLKESTYSGRLAVRQLLPLKSKRDLTLKAGLGYDYKARSFREMQYEFDQDGTFFSGDFVEHLGDHNLWSEENPGGVYVRDESQLRNQYDASLGIVAGYAMAELPLGSNTKMTTGVRAEQASLLFTSYQPAFYLENTPLLADLDILPSLGIVHNFGKSNKMNLRLGINRTIARPSFREIAPVAFFDVVNNFILLGNQDLRRALVDNFDLRFEYYMETGERFAASAFYKRFIGHIELAFNPQAPNLELQYRNSEQTKVYGVELEVRKYLNFIPALSNFLFSANLTVNRSSLTMDSLEYLNIRALDPEAKPTRPMYGQSPYLANAMITYTNAYGTTANLSFNVQGPRLFVVSRGGTPNIFEQPFPFLSLRVSQQIEQRYSVTLSASNLLNAQFRQTQEFKEQEYLFRANRPGMTFSLSFGYSFQ